MPWLALALFVMIAVLLRQPVIGALFALAEECSFHWGAYRGTLGLTRAIGLLGADAFMRRSLLQLRVHAHEALGETARAVEGARRLADEARAVGDWSLANTAINTFINAGLYREALEVERGWEPQEEPISEEWGPDEQSALARFNLCEAHYNLGDWEAASECLRAVEEAAVDEPMLRQAIPMQRAWIQAHTGHEADALATLDQLNRKGIPRVYWSEVAFTRAAVLLAMRRYDEAASEARAGLKFARRVASTRNGLFMLGRIALAEGRLEEAARHFEAGAAHPYKGQGGGALLAWGDCLEKLGRGERAREAWRLVLERDPQSAAAREAGSRLGAAG
ncbi:tetratricopeptide repeat protein [Archangium lansingense]|uniref:Tetratricopeptide repeat protein n=1 Tax=Archangium lansingense TaxID=2995310 RepID=A0ABT4AEP6_9BACT|nr:tetratricopeptide repeat protein [Archangium lansinium]MCY1080135.1 tetratricopeptide repeat protein [Archangium lansinium]